MRYLTLSLYQSGPLFYQPFLQGTFSFSLLLVFVWGCDGENSCTLLIIITHSSDYFLSNCSIPLLLYAGGEVLVTFSHFLISEGDVWSWLLIWNIRAFDPDLYYLQLWCLSFNSKLEKFQSMQVLSFSPYKKSRSYLPFYKEES